MGVIILKYSTIGKGKNIIFLHGWGCGIDSFEWIADFFCDYQCIFFDLHSLENEEKVLTLSDFAQAVSDDLGQLNIEKAIFVGHSFGGRVAILLASTTTLVDSLVLVDSAGVKPRRHLGYYLRKTKYEILKYFHCDLSKCGSPDYRALSPIAKKTFNNIVNEHLEKHLHNIKCQSLIMWGKKDKETPYYMAKKLQKNILNSAIITLKGGHFAYIDDKEKFVAVLKSFCGSIYAVDNSFDNHDNL